MDLAKRQRSELCDNFLTVGAVAPTHTEGWQAQDLAAHLYVREHRPSALPGIALEQFADRTQRIQTEVLHELGFEGLVEAIRTPVWFMQPVDRWVNAVEYSIHHLDLAKPNNLDVHFTDQDQKFLSTFAALLARRTGKHLILDRGGERKELGRGAQPVTVKGAGSELLYFFSGRTDFADVELIGEPYEVDDLKDSIQGM